MSKSTVFRSAFVVSACTTCSRVLGLVREILMAFFFGTSLAKSAFDIAFVIPNLFRRLFGEGALSSAFVPVFTETLEKEGKEKANVLASETFTLLGTVLTGIVIAGILLATAALQWIPMGAKAHAVLPLLRITLPYLFFICMVALCMAVLNSLRHFLIPASTPILLNVIWILAIIFLCPLFGETPAERIYGAAWGILIAGVVQLGVQIPALMRLRVRLRFSFRWNDPRVKKVLLLMGPAALGMGLFQVNAVVDRLLALSIEKWATAALTYAERLIYLPLGVFATALGTVLLPTFSRQAAWRRHDEIRGTLGWSIRNLLFVMIPAAVGLCVLARPIVQLFFEWSRGEFSAYSTEVTARAVMFYAPGLVVFSLYKVLVPAFYAMKDTRTPVRIGMWVVVLNFALNIAFILTWPQGYRHAGLAFATVLASLFNCVALSRILERRVGSPGWPRIAASALRVSIASGLMAVGIHFLHRILRNAVDGAGWDAKLVQAVSTIGAVIAGVAVYVVLANILCRPEIREIRSAIRQKGMEEGRQKQ